MFKLVIKIIFLAPYILQHSSEYDRIGHNYYEIIRYADTSHKHDLSVGMGNYSINRENRDNLASNNRIVTIFLVFNNRKSQ